MKKIFLINPIIVASIIFLVVVACKKEEPANLSYGTLMDIEGNNYKTIQIGTQIWMAENLKTSKYNNGTDIPLVTEISSSIPGYCWYGNNASANKDTYGALYNWFAIITGKLCPEGWHVPSNDEWTILVDYLGGDVVAAGKLKEKGPVHWQISDLGASNTSGFTALPGGAWWDGLYGGLGEVGLWWTATVSSPGVAAMARAIENSGNGVFESGYTIFFGLSVRCLKDN